VLQELRATAAPIAAAAAPPGPAEAPRNEVRLEGDNGTFTVPGIVNRSVRIPFVLDTGSADVQVPAEVVFTLLRTGILSKQDFIGARFYTFADGRTVPSLRVNIREMQVGGLVVRNVPARISEAVNSDALLGQSFLSKIGSWSLDNKRHLLVLSR
jgi:clan AA aspartic protease (TIGR02281 family)